MTLYSNYFFIEKTLAVGSQSIARKRMASISSGKTEVSCGSHRKSIWQHLHLLLLNSLTLIDGTWVLEEAKVACLPNDMEHYIFQLSQAQLATISNIFKTTSCLNKLLWAGKLEQQKLFRSCVWRQGVQNQGVGRAGSFWWLWRRICSAAFLPGSGVLGLPWVIDSWFQSLLLLFPNLPLTSVRTPFIRLGLSLVQ